MSLKILHLWEAPYFTHFQVRSEKQLYKCFPLNKILCSAYCWHSGCLHAQLNRALLKILFRRLIALLSQFTCNWESGIIDGNVSSSSTPGGDTSCFSLLTHPWPPTRHNNKQLERDTTLVLCPCWTGFLAQQLQMCCAVDSGFGTNSQTCTTPLPVCKVAAHAAHRSENASVSESYVPVTFKKKGSKENMICTYVPRAGLHFTSTNTTSITSVSHQDSQQAWLSSALSIFIKKIN